MYPFRPVIYFDGETTTTKYPLRFTFEIGEDSDGEDSDGEDSSDGEVILTIPNTISNSIGNFNTHSNPLLCIVRKYSDESYTEYPFYSYSVTGDEITIASFSTTNNDYAFETDVKYEVILTGLDINSNIFDNNYGMATLTVTNSTDYIYGYNMKQLFKHMNSKTFKLNKFLYTSLEQDTDTHFYLEFDTERIATAI